MTTNGDVTSSIKTIEIAATDKAKWALNETATTIFTNNIDSISVETIISISTTVGK